MFSAAAIRSRPFPFLQKFAARDRAAVKFLRAFVKKCTLETGKICAHPIAKIFAQQFVPKSTPAFIAIFVKTSTQSFNQMFIPTLVKKSAQHFALLFV